MIMMKLICNEFGVLSDVVGMPPTLKILRSRPATLELFTSLNRLVVSERVAHEVFLETPGVTLRPVILINDENYSTVYAGDVNDLSDRFFWVDWTKACLDLRYDKDWILISDSLQEKLGEMKLEGVKLASTDNYDSADLMRDTRAESNELIQRLTRLHLPHHPLD